MKIKRSPDFDEDDEGVVAWMFHGEIAVDVRLGYTRATAGMRLTPKRARRLADMLELLADIVEGKVEA